MFLAFNTALGSKEAKTPLVRQTSRLDISTTYGGRRECLKPEQPSYAFPTLRRLGTGIKRLEGPEIGFSETNPVVLYGEADYATFDVTVQVLSEISLFTAYRDNDTALVRFSLLDRIN